MNRVFVGRQPIFDRRMGVHAYELLFRTGESGGANVVDGDLSTSQVILNAFVEIGLDNIVGESLAFVNLTRAFILGGYARQLPRGRVVLEVLEDVEVDDELVAAVRELKRAGYTVALDDFLFNDNMAPLLPMADIIKVEIPALDPAGIREYGRKLGDRGIKLLAEKVEDRETYDLCKDAGFHLFQGYFFARPTVVRGRQIPPNRVAALQLLSKLNAAKTTLSELETLLSRDVTLSYKLLKIINSAFYGLTNKVGSIRQAMTLLGNRRLRSWVTMIVMATTTDKPRGLMVNALVRAKMCEALAESKGREDSFFTVGLFSSLDAMLDANMEDVLTRLPLADDVAMALLRREGPLGNVLDIVLAYERAEWNRVARRAADLERVRSAYLGAVQWADEASRAMMH